MNAPTNYNKVNTIMTLNALESARNKAGADANFFNQIKSQWGKHTLNDAGSTCKFKLWSRKPVCAAASTIKTLCDNSNTNAPTNKNIEYDVKISEGAGLDGLIEPSTISCLMAGTQAEVLQAEISDAASNILVSVNSAALSAAALLMGAYSTGTESQTVAWDLNLFTDAALGNFQIQSAGWMPLLLEYQKMQTRGGVIAVGGDLAAQYQMMPGLTRGIAGEYQLPQDIDLWFDQNANTLLSTVDWTNPMITWAPGAILLMRYMDNWNIPENHIEDANVSKGIVSMFGHDFDLSISRDGKCNKLRWTLNYVWDLFSLPVEAWGGCVLTNQKLAFDIGCAPYACEQLIQD